MKVTLSAGRIVRIVLTVIVVIGTDTAIASAAVASRTSGAAATDAATASPTPTPTPAPPHVAVFNLAANPMDASSPTWTSLFFSGETTAAKAARDAFAPLLVRERDETVEDSWRRYHDAQRAATAHRESLLKAGGQQLDKAEQDVRDKLAEQEKAQLTAKLACRLSECTADDAEKARQAEADAEVKASTLRATHTKRLEQRPALEYDVVTLATESAASTWLKPALDLLKKYDIRVDSIQGALDTVGAHRKDSQPRFISTDGDEVHVYVVYGGDRRHRPKVSCEEVARASQIATDLGELGKLLAAGKLPIDRTRAAELNLFEPRTLFLAESTCTLTKHRGTLTIDVASGPPAKAAVAVEPKKPEASGATAAASGTATSASGAATAAKGSSITTGPPEHWFLSANVNVGKISELKFDSKENEVAPKAESPRFMLGVNYYFGDLAATRRAGPYVSLLIEPSRRPTSRLGVAAGVRLGPFKKGPFQLDAISPFVAYLWATTDTTPSANAAKGATPGATEGGTEAKRRHVLLGGLSFNLDRIAGWLKKDSK